MIIVKRLSVIFLNNNCNLSLTSFLLVFEPCLCLYLLVLESCLYLYLLVLVLVCACTCCACICMYLHLLVLELACACTCLYLHLLVIERNDESKASTNCGCLDLQCSIVLPLMISVEREPFTDREREIERDLQPERRKRR